MMHEFFRLPTNFLLLLLHNLQYDKTIWLMVAFTLTGDDGKKDARDGYRK